MPLPREEATPPVTKTYFAMGRVLRGFFRCYPLGHAPSNRALDPLIPTGIIETMPMTLRLTAPKTEALPKTARRERRSMQEVARTAIDDM